MTGSIACNIYVGVNYSEIDHNCNSLTNGKFRILFGMFDHHGFSLKALFLLGLVICSISLTNVHADNKLEIGAPQKVNILFAPARSETLNVSYHLAQPLRRLNMGPLITANHMDPLTGREGNAANNLSRSIDDFRVREWSISNSGFQFETEKGFLFVARRDAAAFTHFSLLVPRHHKKVFSLHRPVTSFHDGGGVLYTGFFQPFLQKTSGTLEWMTVRYEFSLPKEYDVSGYLAHQVETNSEVTLDLKRENRPFFIYFGPFKARPNSKVSLVFDQDLPAWIETEIDTLIPRMKTYLQTAFQSEIQGPVFLFMTTPNTSDTSIDGHSFRGDALPSQILVRLNGQGWNSKSERGLGILRKNILHEFIHLWQLKLRLSGDLPDWVHEGAAEAISSEAMFALGFWDRPRFTQEKNQAKNKCTERISGRSLFEADKTGLDRVSYYCGQMLSEIAALGTNGNRGIKMNLIDTPVTVFWREFLKVSREAGYSYENWLDYVRAHEIRSGFSRAINQFVKTSALVHRPKIDHLDSLTMPRDDIGGRER